MGTNVEQEKKPSVLTFTKLLRKRTNQKRTASAALNNLTLPLALSSPQVYLKLVRAFQYILSAFEDEFEKRRRVYPRLNVLHFRELLRAPAFKRDAEFFVALAAGQTGTATPRGARLASLSLPPPPARAQQFVREMRIALAREPVLVIAYSYALYMGLFVGGTRTAPWVRRAFELEGNVGTAAWDFSDTIPDRKAFRAKYDLALNDFSLSDAQRESIFAEVHRIFGASSEIFAEVKASAEYTRTITWAVTRGLLGVTSLAVIAWTWAEPFKWALTELFSVLVQ